MANNNLHLNLKEAILIALLFSMMQLSFADEVVQKLEKQQDFSKSIVLNQKLLIDYDRDIFKHAYFIDFDDTSKSDNDFCIVKQRTVVSSSKIEQDFDFNDLKLTGKDEILAFQLVGSNFVSVSKLGMVSLFSISKDSQKLEFIESINLNIQEALDYQPIILAKDQNQSLILFKNQISIIDLKSKKAVSNKEVNLQNMTKNAIYVDETLYVPLRTEGLLVAKLQVDASNNIVIQQQSKITQFNSNTQQNNCDVTDIYYSKKTNQFFILDYKYGIYVTNDQINSLIHYIPKINSGYSFSIYENSNNEITIVVLFQKVISPMGISVYLKEKDTSSSTSRKYIHEIDQPIRLLEAERSKVFAFDHFALFQGKSTHALSYHSTFQNRQSNYYNRIPDFLTKDKTNTIIIVSKDLSPYNQTDNDFLVFSFFNKGYQVSQLAVQAPQLTCQPKLESDLGLYNYQISLYSNHCLNENTSSNQISLFKPKKQINKQAKNKMNKQINKQIKNINYKLFLLIILGIWIECLISQNITVDVENIIVDESNGLLIAAIVLLTILSVIILIFVIYNTIRKYKARIQGLEREFVQLSADNKKFKYQEMEQEV
ncbi:amine-terminal domain cyclin (macronuclear) [Tetrahymena thermophila SB210]|uniref:Amine-terminal domain cyclin n=1 Tax=Tetrahymena thermophila (strain SB210) TaxID=312017 RepID=Q22LT6_TETTS|nr:amine-terminal domain cyclin [Tetrahymena thermophila SB210]EAR86180.2 amine-terminal domain cyclin [Tetrahymena thermophila SB210]|eukprot:XP_976775.2 amine-terminal domain cyclin [Tetrahymena thermophila SB210]